VTASEAGQQKRLLLLDNDWQAVDSIPINIGRKYYRVSTPAAASNAGLASTSSVGAADVTPKSDVAETKSDQGVLEGQQPTEAAEAAAAEAAAAAAAAAARGVLPMDLGAVKVMLSSGELQAGSLVHVQAEQDDGSESDVQQLVQMLRDNGEQLRLCLVHCLAWEPRARLPS
jgi:hypothetical protein